MTKQQVSVDTEKAFNKIEHNCNSTPDFACKSPLWNVLMLFTKESMS